ncbi:MAG: MarR family transcriptional regulator [Bacteroidales bacterium]
MENYGFARELILQMLKTRMAFRQTLQRVLKRNNIDITFEMLQIMNCLWHKQGVSQQVLAEKTAKDKACLTNLMTNLEKKGFVIRKEDPNDRRSRLVYLTSKGEDINNNIRPLIMEMYSKAEIKMEIEDVTLCINQLKKLDEILNQL